MNVSYLNVDCLKNQELFAEKFQQMSSQRKEKILSYKYDSDKRLSLGAGILLDEGLKKIGYREKELICLFNEKGKPYYKELPQFYFNLSHSGHYAAAVFGDTPVGIDIEEKKSDKMRLSIAKRFFHEKEYTLLKNIENKKEQAELFYRIWTLKESFVKAAGEGMSISFSSFCTLPYEIFPQTNATAINNTKERKLTIGNEFSIETEQTRAIYFKQYDKIQGYCLAVCLQDNKEIEWRKVQI